MDVIDAIKSRRSIRKYATKPIDDRTLEAVMEAARWAPSWANTQCWRFIMVRDQGVKQQLVSALSANNRGIEAILNAPVTIVACAELGKAGYYHDEPCTDKGDWYMFDVALAMQNLVLAAHALGLGTVYIGNFDAGRAAAYLGVPAGFAVVAITPLGYPEQEGRVTPRKELTEIISYDKFGVGKGA